MSIANRTSEQDFDLTNSPVDDSTKHQRWWLGFKKHLRWSIYVILAAFSLYRLAIFRPLPVDSPGTLRPLLYFLFDWFVKAAGSRADAFAKWSTICSLALFIPATLAILNYARLHALVKLPRRAERILCSRWLFFTSIGVCLVLCRYPTLLLGELNPDEGAFIASAYKLFYDPNFFHSVDCATNGPLNIYPLMLPAIFGFSPDFASSRMLAILCVFLCSLLFYRSITLIAPDALARFALLPLIGAMATFKDTELRHYSSEYVPLLLISVSLYLSVRVLRHPARYRVPVFLLGLLSCAAFFAKMQSVPIVVSLAMVALAYVYASRCAETKFQPVLLFFAGTMPLIVINTVLCISAGVWRDFWNSYIRSNLNYAQGGAAGFVVNLRPFTEYLFELQEARLFFATVLAVGIAYFLERMRQHMKAERRDLSLIQLTAVSTFIAAGAILLPFSGWTVYIYLVLTALCLIPLHFAVLYSSKSLSLHPVSWFGFLAMASSAASFYCIYRAHHPFRHYLIFLYLPLCALVAWMLIGQAGPLSTEGPQPVEGRQTAAKLPRGFNFVALLLLLTFTYQGYLWGLQDDQLFQKAPASIRPGEGEFIRSVASPGPTIFVWGWNSWPYLGSGRVTSTRDVTVHYCCRIYLQDVPPTSVSYRNTLKLDHYYQKRIVHDLHAHPPELFIDVISEGSWFIGDRKYFGFETIPELNEFVRLNYIFLTEMYSQRYYLRRDLAVKWASVRSPRVCAPGALTCFAMPSGATFDATTLAAHKLPAIQLSAHILIEAQFTPIGAQTNVATVFSNEAVSGSFRGFRFQSIGKDQYRLVLGLGKSWAFSKPIVLPQGKLASLSIEFKDNDVYLRCNGVAFDDMHLSSRIADTSGPVTIGSWIDGQCRFSGAIQFFQILDLEKSEFAKIK